MGATNVFTGKLTNSSLTISASQNVFRLTVLCKTGDITFLGNAQFSGLALSPNEFSSGQGCTITSAGTGQPLDGITIVAPTTNDVAEILLTLNL
jgi:hypothetical protein